MDIYNFGSSSWLPSLNLTAAGGNLLAIGVGKYAIFASGNTAGTELNGVDILDTATNTWCGCLSE